MEVFFEKVVGVTFKNKDGSNRQDYIKQLEDNEPLELELYEYEGAPAVRVNNQYGQCIGHLRKEFAPEIHKYYQAGYIFEINVSNIFGKDKYGHWIKGYNAGVEIVITAYAPDEKTEQKTAQPQSYQYYVPQYSTSQYSDVPKKGLTKNENSIFDKMASWIDKTFFGSEYNVTTEKMMIVALCTNVFGLHRVYAGRKIAAVIGWVLLLLSLSSRNVLLCLLIPWLIIELIRIYLGGYGRLKSKQKLDFNRFKALFANNAHIKNKAISCGVSVLVILLILAFASPASGVATDPTVSGSDIAVSQSDSNILMNAKIHERPVINGSGTERIGTYAYIEIDKETMKKACSENDYIEFLNERVNDSGYNWFTIAFEDNTGIQFAGSIIYYGTYGKLDDDYCIEKPIGDVIYSNDKVTYEERK